MDELVASERDCSCLDELGSIAARVAAGNTAAERLLVLRLIPGLNAICRRYFGQGPAASDARQEALLILLQKLRAGEIHNHSAVSAFLRGVVLNLSRRAIRERTKSPVFASANLDALSDELSYLHSSSATLALERSEMIKLVQRCLDGLAQQRDRDILFRCYFLAQDKATVCAELKLDGSGFDRIISRAKQRLRAQLAPLMANQQLGLPPGD